MFFPFFPFIRTPVLSGGTYLYHLLLSRIIQIHSLWGLGLHLVNCRGTWFHPQHTVMGSRKRCLRKTDAFFWCRQVSAVLPKPTDLPQASIPTSVGWRGRPLARLLGLHGQHLWLCAMSLPPWAIIPYWSGLWMTKWNKVCRFPSKLLSFSKHFFWKEILRESPPTALLQRVCNLLQFS